MLAKAHFLLFRTVSGSLPLLLLFSFLAFEASLPPSRHFSCSHFLAFEEALPLLPSTFSLPTGDMDSISAALIAIDALSILVFLLLADVIAWIKLRQNSPLALWLGLLASIFSSVTVAVIDIVPLAGGNHQGLEQRITVTKVAMDGIDDLALIIGTGAIWAFIARHGGVERQFRLAMFIIITLRA